MNSVLRVMISSEHWLDFQAGPFIEDWRFADHKATVIVRSRGRHGPSRIQRFSLTTGKGLDSTKGSARYSETPDWAKPLADDQPKTAAQPKANKALVPTTGAALSAMLSVTLTRHPVSTLTPAPAVGTA